jgi:ketosteroid isomerase-like protein
VAEENTETVRKYLAALGGGDLDDAAEFWSPDIDWRAIEGALDDIGVFKGHQAMRDYYEQWNNTFEEIRIDLAGEPIEAGDKVVAPVRVTARMKESNAEVQMALAVLFTLADGMIIRGREFGTSEEALKAAQATG